MNELLAQAIAAHRGFDRWNKLNKVSATIVAWGGLLPMKGLEIDSRPLEGTVTTRFESTTIEPFGQPDWRMNFTPDRVVIETTASVLVNERSNPPAAFAGHTMNTAWDLLHRAYFNGYARWTYLTTPFFMAMQGLRWQKFRRAKRGLNSGVLCARGFRTRSPATAKSRIPQACKEGSLAQV